MRTLRARLTFWYIAIVTAALILFAILLYAWLARTLYAHHDHELLDDAARLAQSLDGAVQPLAVLASLDASQRVGPLLMVRDSTGATVFRSARLASGEPDIGEHTALQHAAMRGSTTAEFFTVRLERGAPVRFICLPLAQPSGTYLQLGRRLGDVDLLLRVVLIASLSLIPVVVLLTSYGGLFVAKRALTPIAGIAATLESIQATDLSRRVGAGPADAEISRLAASVNQLLDRLQRAFASLREFSADVSHQMQTPLTIMKSGVDVTLSARRTPEEYEQTLRELTDEIDALAATVRDVREFSLTDVESSGPARGRVDLTAVFMEAVDLIGVLAEERGITCATSADSQVEVWGNSIRLRQLLLNLGENAIQYTPAGGQARFELSRASRQAVITIADTGPGIAPAALPHVFERRYRGEPARAGAGAGTGLGLALAKRTVEAHGGDITIDSPHSGGTTVTVRLPLAD
jgi:signal transduction histidine kinase